ncbi:uncharacterized protein [Cicer arietinum]|uniref:uncharacterized protein n=1 Tax=Cicer arietinum TaxID=3827 RepID=UPI003CC634DA
MKKEADKDKIEDDPKLWGVLLFGLIGATATTLVFGQLRKTVEWFSVQVIHLLLFYYFLVIKFVTVACSASTISAALLVYSVKKVDLGRERIRRMQNVFNRERNKYKRGYESWREHGAGAYHQHFQREDWYWKADTSHRDRRTNYRETPRESGNYALSHHYSVLGLDRFRKTPYSDAEIKSAFRTKAKEYHPDQNQDNKDVAEAKFKEVMTSFEAIKQERKNHNP